MRMIRTLGTGWKRELRPCNSNADFLIFVLALLETMSNLPLASISNCPLLREVTYERIAKLVNIPVYPARLTCQQSSEIGSTS